MLIIHAETLAFGQHVLAAADLVGVRLTSLRRFLREVPEDFNHVALGCGCGQEVHVWADDCGAELLVVMPGIAIFEADWTDLDLVSSKLPLAPQAHV